MNTRSGNNMSTISNATLQQNIDNLTTLVKDSVAEIKAGNDSTRTELTAKIDDLAGKFDVINFKLGKLDERVERSENKIGEIDAKVDNSNDKHAADLQALTERVKKIEDKVGPLENLPDMVDELRELTEERTNRQLRETLIFKNIPEVENEKWEDTKELLAKTISETCETISYDDAFNGIKRCHRESAKKQEQIATNGRPSRAGKRHIYAALFSWELCQEILEAFRKKCVMEHDFKVFAEQMYGPLTTKRRDMAMELRKRLKDGGTISGGYVAFPAKLFVNRAGHVDVEGKKIYKFHTDFSRHEVRF